MTKKELLQKAKQVLDDRAKENKRVKEEDTEDKEALSLAIMINSFETMSKSIDELATSQYEMVGSINKLIERLDKK